MLNLTALILNIVATSKAISSISGASTPANRATPLRDRSEAIWTCYVPIIEAV